MKNKMKLVITFACSVTITILVLGAYLLYIWIPFELSSPSLMILTRPRFQSSLYLYQEGLQDRDISLLIPLSQPYGSFKRIARWENHDFEVVWSKDESVLAMKLNKYFLAYDFKSDTSIPSQDNKILSVQPSNPTVPQQICNLINERGGPGVSIPCPTCAFVKVRYSYWKKFNAALKAGEHAD